MDPGVWSLMLQDEEQRERERCIFSSSPSEKQQKTASTGKANCVSRATYRADLPIPNTDEVILQIVSNFCFSSFSFGVSYSTGYSLTTTAEDCAFSLPLPGRNLTRASDRPSDHIISSGVNIYIYIHTHILAVINHKHHTQAPAHNKTQAPNFQSVFCLFFAYFFSFFLFDRVFAWKKKMKKKKKMGGGGWGRGGDVVRQLACFCFLCHYLSSHEPCIYPCVTRVSHSVITSSFSHPQCNIH